MTNANLWSRREWLKVTGIALGSLLIPIGCGRSPPQSTAGTAPVFNPSAWLSVDRDGRVRIIVVKSEMGQGVRTTLATVVADELGAAWDQVSVHQADTQAQFGEFSTGGSSSLSDSWLPLRTAAAAARTMLIQAAAVRWRVPAAECIADSGRVAHHKSERVLAFGALAAEAALLPVPTNPVLKRPEDFRLIGQRIPRIDAPDIVCGRAVYGIDVTVPGMRYAAVARSPFLDGVLKSFNEAAARGVRGVSAVVVVPHEAGGRAACVRPGVAVIASSTYSALKAQELLAVQWQPPARPLLNTTQIYDALKSMRREGARIAIAKDSPVSAEDGRTFSADYLVPYAAHAALEPLSCTAAVSGGHCEVWAGLQSPTNTQRLVARALRMPAHKVIIYTQLLGGGFGRRLNADFVVEAALLSQAIRTPLKVTWSRADDLQNDFYRPASYQSLSARVNAQHRLLTWHHLVIGPSTVRQIDGVSTTGPERQEILGLEQLPYEIPHYRVDYLECNPAQILIGWWRGIANTQNIFAVECFISELAAALAIDPIEFRLRHVRDERLRRVIEITRDRFHWNDKAPSGSAYGFAACNYHGTKVALALEATGEVGSTLRVKRVTCTVDCGLVVNPSVVESQAEGAIVWGLSAALAGEVAIEQGRVAISNFNDYPMLRLPDTPHIDIHLVPSRGSPSGIGEPVVPIVAPALAAAASQLAGQRIGDLPLHLLRHAVPASGP